MGVEYYAVNYEEKMYYDLGKGGWYNLSEGIHTAIVFGSRRKLKRLARKAFSKKIPSWYYDKIARKLAKISPFVIIDDCGSRMNYIEDNDFRCLGSRYL